MDSIIIPILQIRKLTQIEYLASNHTDGAGMEFLQYVPDFYNINTKKLNKIYLL